MKTFRPERPASRFRGSLVKLKAAAPVEREGGRWGAGLIRGVSLCTVGEALGHGLWLDTEFVCSVFDQFNVKAGSTGLKARFTHPGLSADGLCSYLGRYFHPVLSSDEQQVFGDLHFAPSAHATPDGDLAAYLMDRAEEDPLSFGLSIVFQRDWGKEDKFIALNEDEHGNFRSPDPSNKNHYPHARLAALRGCDAVDEPAANPAGLFHRGPALALEATAAYALGLSAERPQTTALDVDPDRLRDFANRFLQSHGLQLVPAKPEEASMKIEPAALSAVAATGETDETVADTPVQDGATPAAGQEESTPQPSTDVAPPPAAAASATDPATVTLRKYLELFGDAGGRYLAEGLSIEQAYGRELAASKAAGKELLDKLGAAEAQLASVTDRKIKHATKHLEEAQPLKTGRDTVGHSKTEFASLFRIRRN